MKIEELVTSYLRYLHALGRSRLTIKGAKSALGRFLRFLEESEASTVEGLTRELLSDYQEEISFSLTAGGKPLSLRTREKLLVAVKGFTRFLKERDYLVHNPGEAIRLPKSPKRLPRAILTQGEVRSLIDAADTGTNRGYRNRAILEVLYDTGIRRAEASAIRTSDLDLESGYIRVCGKGDKERVVPLSKRVCELVKNYILMVRPTFLTGADPGYLFLNRWGARMDPMAVWAVVKRCVELSGMKKKVSTHTLRHACATHMLKNGAPIRHLQEMLGHESLKSTEIYTRVTINDLKEIHAKYHPSETLRNEPE